MHSSRETGRSTPPGAGLQDRPPYSVKGRCLLPSGEEHPCLASRITGREVEIAVRVPVCRGATVICSLDNVGMLRGTVTELRDDGFRLAFGEMSEAHLTRVAARVEWYEMRAAESAEQRASPRIVPVRQDTQVWLGENLVVEARIVDVSRTGIAIAIDGRFQPFTGSVVRIGKRLATVVRPIAGGFAAEFKSPFGREAFGRQIVV